MNKTELKALIAEKEAELKALKAQLKEIQEVEKVAKEEKVEINIDLNELEECNSKIEATEMLKDLKVNELKAIAKKYELNINNKNKQKLKSIIIDFAIGNKIEENSIINFG